MPGPEERLEELEREGIRFDPALWRELAEYGRSHGVTRICFELHPVNLVYNVPTLLLMREAALRAPGLAGTLVSEST